MNSLNFLPDTEKITLQRELRNIAWQNIAWTFCLVSLAVAGLIGLNLWLIINYNNDLEARLNTARQSLAAGQNESIENSIRAFNKGVKLVEAAVSIRVPWSDRLTKLSRSMPDRVQFDQVSVDRLTKTMVLRGRALDRASYLEFRDALGQTGWFEDLELPITDLLSRDIIQFNFRAALNDSFFKFN